MNKTNNVSYSHKLQNPKWQRKRLEVLQRDNFSCKICKENNSTLHVHHLKYNGNPWESDLKELTTLCKDCHKLIHDLEDSGDTGWKLITKEIIYDQSCYYIFFEDVVLVKLTNESHIVSIEKKSIEYLSKKFNEINKLI